MAALAYIPSGNHALDRAHERELDEQVAFEDRAERAGCALTAKLEALEKLPQHQRDAAYLELIRDIYTGSRYGRDCLHSLLEKLAQDVDREPSELVIRWHGGAR
jgi:hypothetical protein